MTEDTLAKSILAIILFSIFYFLVYFQTTPNKINLKKSTINAIADVKNAYTDFTNAVDSTAATRK